MEVLLSGFPYPFKYENTISVLLDTKSLCLSSSVPHWPMFDRQKFLLSYVPSIDLEAEFLE